MEPAFYYSRWYGTPDNTEQNKMDTSFNYDPIASDTETIDETRITAEILIHRQPSGNFIVQQRQSKPVYLHQYQYYYDPSAHGHAKRVSPVNVTLGALQIERAEEKRTGFPNHEVLIRTGTCGMQPSVENTEPNNGERCIVIRQNRLDCSTNDNQSPDADLEKTLEQVSDSFNPNESLDIFDRLFSRYDNRNEPQSDTDMDDLLVGHRGTSYLPQYTMRRSFNRGSATCSPHTYDKTRCHGCQKPVYAFEGVHVMERIYHKLCFRCHKCHRVLSVGNFNVGEGIPFCEQHYMELFKVRGRYDGPIQGESIHQYNDLRIHQTAVQSGASAESDKDRPRPLVTRTLVRLFQKLGGEEGGKNFKKFEDMKLNGRPTAHTGGSMPSTQRASDFDRTNMKARISKEAHGLSHAQPLPCTCNPEREPTGSGSTKELVAKFTALMWN